MELKCSKCGKRWQYGGKKGSGAYATCPDCRLLVKIPEEKKGGN